MADYTVIADVSRTLIQLFRDHLVPEPVLQPELIGLASPADKGDLVLSLFLYNIEENGLNRQAFMTPRGNNGLQHPPLAVDLHYLITAHSNAEVATRALDEHSILGRAVQVLYDNATLKGSVLQGSLGYSDEELRVVFEPINMDTMVSLFPSNSPYKLSFSFTVGPVYIDSERVRPMRRVTTAEPKLEGME